MNNIAPIEANIFSVFSIYDNGGFPSTSDGQNAEFARLYSGLPVVQGVLGYISPILAPYLAKQFPWLPDAVASLPQQESVDGPRVQIEDADGPITDDTFAGFVRYMNVVYAAMQKLVDEHGDTIFVQPLTDAEQDEVRQALLALNPR